MDGYTDEDARSATDRYYVTTGGKEREVGRREYVSIQNSTGFKSKFGTDEIAASSFASGMGESRVAGRVDQAAAREALKDISRGPADTADTEQGPMPRSSDFSR